MLDFVKRLNADKILSNCADYHIPVALLVFGITTYYHFHTGKDLGANYTNSLYAFYGFLAGHRISQQFGSNGSSGTGPGSGQPGNG